MKFLCPTPRIDFFLDAFVKKTRYLLFIKCFDIDGIFEEREFVNQRQMGYFNQFFPCVRDQCLPFVPF